MSTHTAAASLQVQHEMHHTTQNRSSVCYNNELHPAETNMSDKLHIYFIQNKVNVATPKEDQLK